MIDIEAVLIAWLEDTIEDVRASTKTPHDLDDQLPWLQVVRIGGPYDGYRRDQPTLDIAAYGTGTAASDLALHVQELLHEQLRGSTTGGAVISRVETRVGPHWVPYDNPNLQRYEATYALVVHPS
jgi:hypothetical protein